MGLECLGRGVRRIPVFLMMMFGLALPASAFELRTGSVLKCGRDLHLYVGSITPFVDDLVAVHVQMFLAEKPLAGHLPFDPNALKRCKLSKLPVGVSFAKDAFEGGFSEWKLAKGGIFTLSPVEVRKMINQMTGG